MVPVIVSLIVVAVTVAVVILTVAVVVKALVLDGVVSNVSVEVLAVGGWSGMVVINEVDVEAIACVGRLVDVNTNVLPGVMTALEFAFSEPFEGFSC